MCRRATHITSRRVGARLAVTLAESLFKALGLVSLTSEGSLGPAVPSVNVPCDGKSPASEISGKAIRETETARPVAIKTATDTNKSRRISPPPRKPNRVGSHCNLIPAQKHQLRKEFLKFFIATFGFVNAGALGLATRKGRERSPRRALPACSGSIGSSFLRSGLYGTPHGVFRPWLGEPAGYLDLVLGEEAHSVLTGGVQVSVEGVLHAVKREEGHRSGDAYVDPEHPGLYVLTPVPDCGPVLGEDGAGVPEGRCVSELYGLIQAICAHDREDGTEDLLSSDAHLAGHLIEDGGPEKETFLQRRLAPVEHDLRPLLLTEVYELLDLLAVGVTDQGRQLAVFLIARPHLHRLRTLLELLDEGIGDLTDGHEDAAGQAPLSGVAVGRGDDVGDGLLEDGVGHHDHGVLRPGQSLHPLAVGGAVLVDVLGDRMRSHEGDGLYAGMLQDGVHRLPGAVDEVEHPVGESRLCEKLPEPHGRHGRSLGGLEDVGVARPDGHRQGPQGHHAREVEGRYGRHNAQGVTVGGVVYPARHVAHRLAHHEGRHPAGELDHLYAAPDLTGGVLCVLAVLQGDEVSEFLEVLLEELLEAEQDPSPLHDRGTGPARERYFGLLDRPIYVLAGGEGRLGDDLAGCRVVDRLGLAPVASLPLAPDQIPYLEGLLSCLHDLLLCAASSRL